MRNAEEAIGQVLAGLREADAPKGMEGRILLAIEQRSAAQESRTLRHGWKALPGWTVFVASGFVAAGILIAFAVPLRHKVAPLTASKQNSNIATTTEDLAGDKEVKADGGLQQPKRSDDGIRDTDHAVVSSNAVRSLSSRTSGGVRDSTSQEVSGANGIPDYDVLALSEMLAPSQPAQPLPLTRQEKLLAQVVHKGKSEQMATLNPDLRAKQMELSKSEFQEFFEPPPVKDDE